MFFCKQLKTRTIFVGLLAMGLSSCATGTYLPPTAQTGPDKFTIELDKGYDDTWTSLIDYSSSTFFAIDNFEKQSGLLTLSFGASNPDRFIDCGKFTVQGSHNWSGPYVQYLMANTNTNFSGKMNIFVKKVSTNKTKVRVNARYNFKASLVTQYINFHQQWSFDSGGSDTHITPNPPPGTDPSRTCQPTYAAETDILEGIKGL